MTEATALLDLNALRANMQLVRTHAKQQAIIAMVKADAYGHGMVAVAKALPEADGFGVARLSEALRLREAGIRQSILLLGGVQSEESLKCASAEQIDLVIHDAGQIALLERCQLDNPVKVWIKVDSGMHRMGFLPEHFEQAYARLHQCTAVAHPIKCMSHFANASSEDVAPTLAQIATLQRAITQAKYTGPISLANSAGLLAFPESHYDIVRPGIILYGISPFSAQHILFHQPIQPVMTLQAPIISIKSLPAGAAIGYGSERRCPKATRVGVVAIGYGDGYPRHALSGTPVLVKHQLTTLLGRVSMDVITIDLSHVTDVNIGDMVTLWGRGLPVETVALHANTIPYQLVTNLSPRVKRDIIQPSLSTAMSAS